MAPQLLFLLGAGWLVAGILVIVLLVRRPHPAPAPELVRPAPVPEPPARFTPLFRAVSAALDAGLIVLDHDRQVQYVNPQAEELFSTRGVAAHGKGLITLVRDASADALVQEVLGDGETRETTVQSALTGRALRLRCQALTWEHGGRGAVLLARDVTQINMLERARRDLVANVSHELRTPLASIKLLVETLQSEPPPEVAQRMLGQVSQEVDAVTQLVDELHELSQIESGRVTLQLAPRAIGPTVERAIARIRPQAERKHLRVVALLSDDLPMALIDEDRVGQVLLNLLHNAVKFTPDRGEITVRGYVSQVPDRTPEGTGGALDLPGSDGNSMGLAMLPPGLWLIVCVSDTGVGIPARDLPRIFERFYKVDRARTRNQGGTGLGLAIAKHLIEGHGGRIWATSQEGRGSVFYFALPVA